MLNFILLFKTAYCLYCGMGSVSMFLIVSFWYGLFLLQYLKFLEQLSEKLKIENLTTELGFDMRLEAILARVEQLTQQEGTTLIETKTLVYSLQKKVWYSERFFL